MLGESVRCFVQAQLNHVGNNHISYGIVASIIFALVCAFLPLTLNLVCGDSRWSHLAALPRLFPSLNGICLAIYFFGDLQQLRKFKLSRPPISKPRPLPPYKRPSPCIRPVSMTNSILPTQHPRQSAAIHPARMGTQPP